MKKSQPPGIRALLILTLSIITFSCKKAFLDTKPNIALVVPSSIRDYQSLLDNSTSTFNQNQPVLGEISCGDLYVPYATWATLKASQDKLGYIWENDIYQGQKGAGDWGPSYTQVLNANIVLEGIEKVEHGQNDLAAWNNVKGSAFFYRAFAFYNIAQVFAKPYSAGTASQDLGIPLRLSPDTNEKTFRASNQNTYDQIIADLIVASQLLPDTAIYKTRPSKCATFGMLARVFLSKKDYDNAYLYADSCLGIYSRLMDFNTLNANAAYPISLLNKEVIFHSTLVNESLFLTPYIDSAFYTAYAIADLRKTIYFSTINNTGKFKGSYDGDRLLFGGLATDEIYLIRAECLARKNQTTAAMNDLNHLLVTRWQTGNFSPLSATSADDALSVILAERHKELCFRALRWTDLRRLNQDAKFAVTLTRTLNGQVYTLPPNDLKYTLPIPPDVITLSGIQQNPR